MDSFSDALVAISVSTELIEEELNPHLDKLLSALQGRQEGAARQIAESGIIPSLAHILTRPNLELKAILIVLELARDRSTRWHCVEAGLGTALLSLLISADRDLLLLSCQAIGKICYDNIFMQDQLIRSGAVPSLAAILQTHPQNEALVSASLHALCGLADMSEEEDGAGMIWTELGPVNQGELTYRGTQRQPSGFTSQVTMVRLNQRAGNQHLVTVQVGHRFSRALWVAYITERTSRRFRPNPLEACPWFCQIMKVGFQSIPKTQSLKARVFQTFL